MSTLKLLQETGSFAPPQRVRVGQPRYDELPLYMLLKKQPIQIAYWVCLTQLRHGGARRGAQSKAINIVSNRHHLDYEVVKKYHARYRHLVSVAARFEWTQNTALKELDERMALFPKDVKERLESLSSASKILEFLREQDINGTAPNELIDWVRQM
jgi:hypothetical protein